MGDYAGLGWFFLTVIVAGIVLWFRNRDTVCIRAAAGAMVVIALMCLLTIRIVQKNFEPSAYDLEVSCKVIGTATITTEHAPVKVYKCQNGRFFVEDPTTK